MPKKIILLIVTLILWGAGLYFLLRPVPLNLLPEPVAKPKDLPAREVSSFQLAIPDLTGQTDWHIRGDKLVEEKEGIFYMTEVSGTIERLSREPLYFYAPVGIYQIAKGSLYLFGPVHLYDSLYNIEMGAMEWDGKRGEILAKDEVNFSGPGLHIKSEYATVKMGNSIIEQVSFFRLVQGVFNGMPLKGEELFCFFNSEGKEEKIIFREGQVLVPVLKR